MYAFELPDRLLRGLLYGFCVASVCFVYVCDVRHLDKRVWICFWRVSGETTGKGTPSPFHGRATVRLPPSKFFYFSKQIFYFFLPYPTISFIYPFSFPLRGFLFLCVYFLSVYLFVSLRGKIRGNKN